MGEERERMRWEVEGWGALEGERRGSGGKTRCGERMRGGG